MPIISKHGPVGSPALWLFGTATSYLTANQQMLSNTVVYENSRGTFFFFFFKLFLSSFFSCIYHHAPVRSGRDLWLIRRVTVILQFERNWRSYCKEIAGAAGSDDFFYCVSPAQITSEVSYLFTMFDTPRINAKLQVVPLKQHVNPNAKLEVVPLDS